MNKQEETVSKHPVEQIVESVGGTIEAVGELPDGSGFAAVSMPLPKDHWLYADKPNEPPMPMRMGLSEERRVMAKKIQAAARYAVRASTRNGQDDDFDPDALVQNMVVGLLGYWTKDGLSSDKWANP